MTSRRCCDDCWSIRTDRRSASPSCRRQWASDWQTYRKGVPGVFSTRGVRLLDTTEGRYIAQHYEAEPEFRDQINRYIHDFEAMLRRLLVDPDGSALSVTILSSDMGKLYVALAQAIERFRN